MNDVNITFETNIKRNDYSNNTAAMAIQLIKSTCEAEVAKAKMVPLSEKKLLSVEEASELFGIGRNKIRELSDDDNCPFVLWIGAHRRIKREAFEEYIMKQYSL